MEITVNVKLSADKSLTDLLMTLINGASLKSLAPTNQVVSELKKSSRGNVLVDQSPTVVQDVEKELNATPPVETKSEPAATTSSVDLTQIRLMAQEKMDKHTDEIAALLREFGVASISKIPKTEFDAFYQKLQAI